jgi:hypothetical protein
MATYILKTENTTLNNIGSASIEAKNAKDVAIQLD